MEVTAMNMNLRNKIAGAIYGFAIGDAMGATTEFMTAEQIKKRYGQVKDIIGGGWLNLAPGEVTDDTQMTMCVMSAIMRQPENVDMFRNFCTDNFIVWLNSGPKDVGGQCSYAIHRLQQGKNVSINNAALGNGSLMRAMPLAVLNLPYLNVVQGKLTHNNRMCSSIILKYTELIQGLLNNNYNNLYYYKIKGLLEPSGYILNTFNNSIYWSRQNSFKEAIIGAVNHGGDADTIAAITGSIAGARFGFNKIPKSWIYQLNPDVKEFLEKFKNFVFTCLQI
jgi:ADP-ribosyl-[dinitrogen reductase] hydrolase